MLVVVLKACVTLTKQAPRLSSTSTILAKSARLRVYSAAYIMPAPKLGHARKHANHLALLRMMMEDGLPARIERTRSLAEVYDLLRPWQSLGSFLAFQYAIDLNYSSLIDFEESSFVVAGPGAIDGISKCFVSTEGLGDLIEQNMSGSYSLSRNTKYDSGPLLHD